MKLVHPQDDETYAGCKGGSALLIGLVVCAIIVRALPLTVLASQLQLDPDNYRLLAETLRTTGVYGWPVGSSTTATTVRPTAFRPPLYPLLLAALAIAGRVAPAAVAGLHGLLGIGTVLLTYLTARRLQLGRYSLLAAAAVACDPILLNQSCLVMTETLATCMATLALYAVSRLDVGGAASASRQTAEKARGIFASRAVPAAIAGSALGLASLSRPTFFAWAALLLLVNLAHAARTRRWSGWLGFALGVGLTVSPWMVRNFYTFGRLSATTTHGGYTLLLGNNPLFYDFLRSSAAGNWDARPLSKAWQLRRYSDDPQAAIWQNLGADPPPLSGGRTFERDEFEDDRFAYRLALHYIRQEPRMFLYSCGVRMARLWQWVPRNRVEPQQQESWPSKALRLGIGGWYAVISLLAACGAWRQVKQLVRGPWLAGMLLLASFTAVHAFYWSNMRMRAPLVPIVCLLAAAGAGEIMAAARRKRHP